MSFEKFIPKRKLKGAQVSIKSTGTISLDSAFAAAFGFAKVSHVTLHFDTTRKMVGVRPEADPRAEGAMRLTHRTRVSSVRARAFFESFGMKIERTMRYPIAFDADESMAVIALEGMKRKRGPKRKA